MSMHHPGPSRGTPDDSSSASEVLAELRASARGFRTESIIEQRRRILAEMSERCPSATSDELAEMVGIASVIEDDARLREYQRRREVDRLEDRRWAQAEVDRMHAPPSEPIGDLALWGSDVFTVEPPASVIDPLVPERAVGFLGAPSGGLKSYVAVDLAVSLAHGVPFLTAPDLAPRAALRVAYVAAEGRAGVSLRVRADLARRGLDADAGKGLAVLRGVRVNDPVRVGALFAWLEDRGVDFLIIDTFRAATPGTQENDNTEVGEVMRPFLDERDRRGLSTLFLDHTTKVGGDDLGGAGAKRANSDYVLMIDPTTGLYARKLKDAASETAEQGRALRLVAEESVRDGNGKPVMVVVHNGAQRGAERPLRPSWHDVPRSALPDQVRALGGLVGDMACDIFRSLAAGRVENGVSRRELQADITRIPIRGERYTGGTTMHQAVRALVDLGVVHDTNPRKAGGQKLALMPMWLEWAVERGLGDPQ